MSNAEVKQKGIPALLHCIRVVFEKFIDENSYNHLIIVLKKNKSISKGQYKKIKETIKKGNIEKAIQKLFNSLEKSELQNFDLSLQDNDFPCNEETKQLLIEIYLHQNENLIFLLQNWDILENNQDNFENIKSFVALQEKDVSWVKRLIISVLKKSSKKINEETEQSITNIVTYIKELAIEDKTEMPKNLKRPNPLVDERKEETAGQKQTGIPSNDGESATVDEQPGSKKKKGNPERGDSDKKNENLPKQGRVFGSSGAVNTSSLRISGQKFTQQPASSSENKANQAESKDGDGISAAYSSGTKSTNKSYADAVQSNDKEASGKPVTRSQTAGTESNQDVQNMWLQPMEDCFINQETDLSIIEFCAVVTDLNDLPPNTTLCINMDCLGWKPKTMNFDNVKGYFSTKFVQKNERSGCVEYKFCYLEQQKNEYFYEWLPGSDWFPRINREIYIQKETPRTLCLNVCMFKSSYYWKKNYCEPMVKFLPEHKFLESDDDRVSAAYELFSWVTCVNRGWQLTRMHIHLNEWDYEEILMDWIKKLSDITTDDKEGVNARVFSALVLAVALAYEQHHVVRGQLLTLLFQQMRIDQLDIVDCRKLYEDLQRTFDSAKKIGFDPPSYREVMICLYKQIRRQNKSTLDWILTLPLYWLMTHGEVKPEVFTSKAKTLAYAKASLPVNEDINWFKIKQSYLTVEKIRDEIQKMIHTVLELSQLHPWIIGTFQFMLSKTEFQHLVLNRKEETIAMLFPVDSALSQYLDWYSKDAFLQMTNQEKKSLENYFHDAIDSLITRASEPKRSECEDKNLILTCLNLLEVVNKFLSQLKVGQHIDEIMWCLDIFLLKSATLASLLKSKLDENNAKKLEKVFDDLLELVEKGINRRTVSKLEVQYWCKLFKCNWDLEWFSEKWNERIIREIQNALNNYCTNNGTEKFLDFYACNLGKIEMQADVEKCLNDRAYMCIEKLLQRQEKHWFKDFAQKFVELFSGKTSSGLITVFDKIFIVEYNRHKENHDLESTTSLEFLCEWTFALQFYELFYGERQKLFPSGTRSTITKVANHFKKIVHSLKCEEIIFEHLKIIYDYKDKFLLLSVIAGLHDSKTESSSVDSNEEDMKILIDKLWSYVKKFKQTRAAVENFIEICDLINHENAATLPHCDLQKKVRMDVTQLKVTDLVRFDENGTVNSIKFFEITDAELVEFEEILFVKDSQIFRQAFVPGDTNALTDDGEGASSWSYLLKHWKNVKAQILSLIEEIDAGTITLKGVFQWFSILEGIEKTIDFEVKSFYDFYSQRNCRESTADLASPENGGPEQTGDGMSNQEKRKQQIYNLFQSEQANNAIELLLELKTALDLNGDFDVLTSRQELINNQDLVLDKVPEDQKIPQICSLDESKLRVLRSFLQETELREWLKEKMHDINEVKLMSDLGMISAGENVIEVDKVSRFLGAVVGFAPLIFCKEKNDEDIGLKELMEKCQQVWKNVKSDENLLKKWMATSEQLPWLKELEKFHGSVEKLSLTRAQEINDRGIYRIKRNADGNILSASNCVLLSILEKDATETKQLNLNKLLDLQSKLMLIAGEAEKGKRDVNLFVSVLTSVRKLAEVFVKLLSSSCMLFKDWSVVITCGVNENEASYLQIQIKFTDTCPITTGYGSCSDIDRLTMILNESLERWDKHVSSVREQHYYLNEYNIQQITYMCQELCRFKETGRFSEQARCLLASVQTEFTDQELIDCLQNISETHSRGDVTEIDEVLMEQDPHPAESENTGELKKKLLMVQKLVAEDNCDENVAKAAVQENGYSDIYACQSWILLHADEHELVKDLSNQFDEFIAFSQEDMDIEVMEDALRQQAQNTLLDIIIELQKDEQYDLLNLTKTICVGYLEGNIVIDRQDHMSLEQCGIFLNNFVRDKLLDRKLMPALRQGKPNLLICSEEEILPTVLSLYMHCPNQPLPSRSEVLICSEDTTEDKAERFFRRAMCKSEARDNSLYCLAFADKLSYAVSSSVEQIFNDLLKIGHLNKHYQLVILLSKQQHYIATCFDKYLVDGKWSKQTKEIQDYLIKHLKALESNEVSASVTKANFSVKVISSKRAGVGKSLYVKRLREEVENSNIGSTAVTIRLLENKLSTDSVIQRLCKKIEDCQTEEPLLVHIDLTPSVQHGVEEFFFNLAVLGSIEGSRGNIWSCQPHHLYLIEMTDFSFTGLNCFSSRHLLSLLPSVKCYSPKEVMSGTGHGELEKIGMDRTEFLSDTYQRPYQYLKRFTNSDDLQTFSYTTPEGTPEDCIGVLLRHCCMPNPSWAQLRHFCSFLNVQLQNCETSIFCNNPLIKQVLVGLKEFAVKFMIRMAQDFATPSLEISDCSMSDNATENEFDGHQMRRKWEESSHPYVFFNDDRETMTFINVMMSEAGHLLDQNGEITEQNIARPELHRGITRQGINLIKKFDDFPRQEKLRVLYQVMGIKENRDENKNLYDPDPSYKLTTDNVLKIMAIYMRFRCQIPVIIMGETGCGKTRLVEFMSMLKEGRKTDNAGSTLENMITLKIHGGISVEDIHKSVRKAKETEEMRMTRNQSTIIFYDEANTTEAIYAIKEVMCDRSIDGESFENSNIQLIAACNPYKKLSEEAIKKLEDSGLGYRFHTSETAHLFGNIPVRTLVYRVVALPPSMQPFVWDFGQLSDMAEKIYIGQMTTKLAKDLELNQKTIDVINNVLSTSQRFMRSCRDECRYVSLRDVERCMTTYEWFHHHYDALYDNIQKYVKQQCKNLHRELPNVDREVGMLIQTVGVCYHASLDEREPYRVEVAQCLNVQDLDELYIKIELEACQSVFLSSTQMEKNIACNEALKENVSMMAICADMQIPLFLIGKPGSSKSLAKTIITSNMQGPSSHAPLYRKLKQIHILSYQCSALTDAVGIQGVFNQCARLQSEQDPNAYTAVVVLDEIGLAEDSPNMPLKVLHPLLERRSTDITTVSQREKVGFVGISNWALDPAKMNRGLFLTRGKPSEQDLIETGKEIVGARNWKSNEYLFEALTSAYLNIYENQTVEYFGLRDYYSLMKMISPCQELSKMEERNKKIVYSIIRNFSGSKESVCDKFFEIITEVLKKNEEVSSLETSVPIENIIRDNLAETDSRFLLLLANQFSVVHLLDLVMDSFEKGFHVVFGSSFPGDHSYTEICVNINKIKVCMETGKTVILLNMNEIHESLYDALNQHYVTFGEQNYVDLGLGGHRVKCRINNNFRLIVIEKKDVVFQKYPIPLINRLEKHHFNSAGLLGEEDKRRVAEIKEWTRKFAKIEGYDFCERDAFIGFHEDTVSSVVLTNSPQNHEDVLLQCCTLDAVFRLKNSELNPAEVNAWQEKYLQGQCHDSLADVLKKTIEDDKEISILEITSYASVLAQEDKLQLEKELNLPKNSIMLLSLEQFQTQQEYTHKLDQFFESYMNRKDFLHHMVLLVQCAQSQSSGSLIACAQHFLMNNVREFRDQNPNTKEKFSIVIGFLLSTEREASHKSKSGDFLALQHTRETLIIYVDELRPTIDYVAPARYFFEKPLHEVFKASTENLDEKSIHSFDFCSLLIDCICESVANVETMQTSERYFKRVELLEKLCTANDIAGENFRKILKNKFVDMLAGKEELGKNNWIVDEAFNKKNLKEGGTFRKTIWLCLKRKAVCMFSFIISIIDKFDNLNIISSEQDVPWKVNIWFGMFQACKFTYPDRANFSITYPVHLKSPAACKLPFSFIIIDLLDSEWRALEKQGMEINIEVLAGFQSSTFHRVIGEALSVNKKNVMDAFISDLVATLYITGTELQDEKDLIERTLYSFSVKNIKKARESNFKCGDEISVIFLTFKGLLKKLEMFSKVLKAYPNLLSMTDFNTLAAKQKNDDEFILLREVFSEAIKNLKLLSETIDKPKICSEWLNNMGHMKDLYSSVISCVNTWDGLKEVIRKWEALSLLYLLLQQLLPLFSKISVYQNYLKIISRHAKLFWTGTFKGQRDPKSYDFLRIVVSVLKKYCLDIKLRLLLDWKDTTCKVCKKRVQDPVFLPCFHFACKACIQSELIKAGRQCPICSAAISVDYDVQSAELDDVHEVELQKTKYNCTSFFLQYLKQFCFSAGQATPSMDKHIKQIIKSFMVEGDGEGMIELDFTSLNLNLNTKSTVLGILMNHSPRAVEQEITYWLNKSDKVNNKNLMMVALLIKFERMLLSNTFNHGTGRNTIKRWEDMLGTAWSFILPNAEECNSTFEIINKAAAIRCAVAYLTVCINDIMENAETNTNQENQLNTFAFFGRDLLMRSEMEQSIKDYFFKVGIHKFGSQWLHKLTKHELFKSLIPPDLMQAAENSEVDIWALIGPEYGDFKSKLYHTDIQNIEEVIITALHDQSTDLILPRILATLFWCNKKDSETRQPVYDILKRIFGNNSIFSLLLKTNEALLPILHDSFHTSQLSNVYYQLIILIQQAVFTKNNVMGGFHTVTVNATRANSLFLPGMPEDLYFTFPQEHRISPNGDSAMYTCPRGHIYSIANCGKPAQVAKCPDCRQQIGGEGYKTALGNKIIPVMHEQSQSGYRVGNSDINLSGAENRISSQGAAVVHFILHACMISGLREDPVGVLRMLNTDDISQAQRLLVQQLQNNLYSLSSALSRNQDDSLLALTQILLRIIKLEDVNQYEDWSTLENRRRWEQKFRTQYLQPVFGKLDAEISDSENMLRIAKDAESASLRRLLHDANTTTEFEEFSWKHASLWGVIDHPSLPRLLQVMEDGPHEQIEAKVLMLILRSHDLHFVKNLETVLRFQKLLIGRFLHKIDLKEADQQTFIQLITEYGFDEIIVDGYISAWNSVYKTLRHNEPEQMQVYFEELSRESPISMGLPSTRGRGQCAKDFVEYLINIQNNFLNECSRAIGSDTRFEEVGVPELIHCDFVCLDKERDLLPMINLHANYNIITSEQQKQHQMSYNIEAIEKQVQEKFVLSKKLIMKKTLPTMKYPQDVGIGSDWKKVLTTKEQKPLTAKLSQDVSRNVERALSADMCEAVRTLTSAICFLAMATLDSSLSLCDFLGKHLKLSSSRTSMIPVSANICHILSLYQKLSWYKAVNFVKQGLDPYEEVLSEIAQEDIPEDISKDILQAFEHMDVLEFQQRLNEMLINFPDARDDWSLTEEVFPYIQFVDEKEDDQWFEKLPGEVCCKHIRSLFSLSVQFMQGEFKK